MYAPAFEIISHRASGQKITDTSDTSTTETVSASNRVVKLATEQKRLRVLSIVLGTLCLLLITASSERTWLHQNSVKAVNLVNGAKSFTLVRIQF